MRQLLVCCLLLGVGEATANPYFVDNPWSPIPPACLDQAHHDPTIHGGAPDPHSKLIWQGLLRLPLADQPKLFWDWNGVHYKFGDSSLRLFRLACAEPNRSVLIASFRTGSVPTGAKERYILPSIDWDPMDWGGPMFMPSQTPGNWSWSLDRSPLPVNPEGEVWTIPWAREGFNAFGDFRHGSSSYDGMDWFAWDFVLDRVDSKITGWGYEPDIAASYNDSTRISIQTWADNPSFIAAPTSTILDTVPGLPLSGRLSGTWVIEGARDQGLILSFTSRVPPAGETTPDLEPEQAPLFMFLTWYTFDAQGKMLWLTGQREFEQGAESVTARVTLTGNGEFLGAKPASRTEAGEIILTAKSCNHLQLDYDLTTLGLGQGSRKLERLFSLEVAGYNCRDYEARQDSLANQP